MKEIAIYPGTFDPITNGHIDIIERAATIFNKVIIGVAEETYKECLFTLKERADLVKEGTKHIPNVQVESFSGLAVNCGRKDDSSVKTL